MRTPRAMIEDWSASIQGPHIEAAAQDFKRHGGRSPDTLFMSPYSTNTPTLVLAMPSNTKADLLLTLAADFPEAFAMDTFQAATGFTIAPFSDNCTADDLGIDGDDYPGAQTAFDAYADLENATARHNFLSKKLPKQDAFYTAGRNTIKNWVHGGWKDWGFSAITKKVMDDLEFDYFKYHSRRGLREVSVS